MNNSERRIERLAKLGAALVLGAALAAGLILDSAADTSFCYMSGSHYHHTREAIEAWHAVSR